MSEKKNHVRLKRYMNALRHGLKHLLLHNGWMKLVAVVISVILWAGLISQDETITRDKTFQNVSVTVTGSETLKNNAYIVVSDLDEMLDNVSVTAAVPQKQYENAEASNYNIRLDLSRINGTGEQEVRLTGTNSPTYGRVISINPSSITVQVEDYMIRERIPVRGEFDDQPTPDEWYKKIESVDPTYVTVKGPSSLVKTISWARTYIDTSRIEWKEGTYTDSSEIHLYNRSGEIVDSPLLSITSSDVTIDNVLVDISLLPRESFETIDLIQISGDVADGYRIQEVRISPEVVWVAAKQDVLDQMSDLLMESNTVDVSGLKENKTFQLKVLKPSEDSILSNETITVTVDLIEDEV